MADTEWSGFPNRAYLLDTDELLVKDAGGGGVNVPGSAVIKKDVNGNVGIGVAPFVGIRLYLRSGAADGIALYADNGVNTGFKVAFQSGVTKIGNDLSAPLAFIVTDVERARFDATGNLLVGTLSGSNHVIQRSVAAGAAIASIRGDNYASAVFYSTGGTGLSQSSAECVLGILGSSATGRSLNAGGSINGAGADPAEYWRRSLSCGTVLAGQICGINADNELTTDWVAAVRFGVKSGLINQPFIVGNDVYAKVYEETAGPAPVPPEAIAPAPVEPVAPTPFTTPEPVQGEGEDTVSFAVRLVQWSQLAQEAATALTAYMAAASAYPAQLAEWTALNATYQDDLSAFEAADAVWRAGLEAERQRWDRISIGGQVYIRTEQPCAAGDYVIPAQVGDGIGFAFVSSAEITFDQYRSKVGVVLATGGDWPLIEVIRS